MAPKFLVREIPRFIRGWNAGPAILITFISLRPGGLVAMRGATFTAEKVSNAHIKSQVKNRNKPEFFRAGRQSNLKGCQIVAGGRSHAKTSGSPHSCAPRRGARILRVGGFNLLQSTLPMRISGTPTGCEVF
jgi:hypothetical protein